LTPEELLEALANANAIAAAREQQQRNK